MIKKREGFGRILHGQIELHAVIIFRLKAEIAVFDKTVPAVFVEAVQLYMLKPVAVQPLTGRFVSAEGAPRDDRDIMAAA